jgi:hypothetical protein
MTEHAGPAALDSMPPPARAALARVQRIALVVGIAGFALCAASALVEPATFFRAYLFAYVFVIGITLGALALVMVHHLSGGAWGLMIRRLLEAATRTLPLLAALFLPILAGLPELYPWAREADVAASELLRHKQIYLNVPFFVARAAFYFASWMALAYFLNRWSAEQDRGEPGVDDRRFRLLAAPGLLVYGLTVTFMAVDWIMSLSPEWFSTIFGVIVMGGQALSAMAFAIAVLFLLAAHEPLSEAVGPSHFHDLGKLMLAFVMLWAYFNYSQFLIVWSGNLPEEIPWYLRRTAGGWQLVTLGLVVGHFVLPFLLLLSRDFKRKARALARIALLVVMMRVVDAAWMVTASFPEVTWLLAAANVAALAGIGGVWIWFYVRGLKARPLLPVHDPYLREAMEHGAH